MHYQKINCALFYRPHTHRNVSVAGEENDGQFAALSGKRQLQFQAVDARHRNIEHQAAGCVLIVVVEELLWRSERGRIQSDGTQRPRKSFRLPT